jgi:hypothetical protein
MQVRPLSLLRQAVRIAIHADVAALVHAWCADWGVDVDAVMIETDTPDTASMLPTSWRAGLGQSGTTLWMAWGSDTVRALERTLFTDGQDEIGYALQDARLAHALSNDAFDALLLALESLLPQEHQQTNRLPGEQPDTELAPFSGALLLTIGLGGGSLACLLGPDAVLARSQHLDIAAPAPATLPALEALILDPLLDPSPVSLRVSLDALDIDLGHLMTAAVGDVLRLDCALERPLQVAASDGHNLLFGHLGRLGSHVALELIRKS